MSREHDARVFKGLIGPPLHTDHDLTMCVGLMQSMPLPAAALELALMPSYFRWTP